jgi:hypothetical protein
MVMRLPVLAVLGLAAAIPSLSMAQMMDMGATTTISQTPNGQRTYTPPPAPNPSSGAAGMNAPQPLGFDAKVKRDPNGKIITDTKSTDGTTNDSSGLRNDQDMRSDKSLNK